MIEIISGAYSLCRGTIPYFSLMGRILELLHCQLQCSSESSGTYTHLYIYVSNSSITLNIE
jgi:hypothetical protein